MQFTKHNKILFKIIKFVYFQLCKLTILSKYIMLKSYLLEFMLSIKT